jgi:hypothetical protein
MDDMLVPANKRWTLRIISHIYVSFSAKVFAWTGRPSRTWLCDGATCGTGGLSTHWTTSVREATLFNGVQESAERVGRVAYYGAVWVF